MIFVSADSPHLSTELVIEGQLQPMVRSETPTSFTTGGAQRPEHRYWHPRSLALQVVRVLRFDTSRRVELQVCHYFSEVTSKHLEAVVVQHMVHGAHH